MGNVRVASPNPAYCTVCYRPGSDPVRFVDFDAAVDGPVVLTEGGTRGEYVGPMVSIDDLYVCEDCLRIGDQALGLEAERAPLEQARLAQHEAEKDAALWRQRAEGLRAAAAEWGPQPEWSDVDRKPKVTSHQADPQRAREDALRLLAAGESVANVARLVGVSQQSIRNWRSKERVG